MRCAECEKNGLMFEEFLSIQEQLKIDCKKKVIKKLSEKKYIIFEGETRIQLNPILGKPKTRYYCSVRHEWYI